MSQDTGFRKLKHCRISTPCEGGTTYMIAHIPSERAVAGNTSLIRGRLWTVEHASVEEDSSHWVAWYVTFHATGDEGGE